jgi:murein tripeptide amidase MpaA
MLKLSRVVLGVVAAFLAASGAGAAQPVAGQADQPAPVSYRGHKLVTVDVKTPQDLARLEQLGVSLACIPALGEQRYVVAPDALEVIRDLKMNVRVEAEDVQTILDAEKATNEEAKNQRDAVFHTAYHNLAEIDQFLTDTVALNPTIASRSVIGTSLQGKPIWAVRIQGPNAANNKSFAIICNIHAREWISPAVGLWTIDKLITEYGTNQQVTDLVNSVNWYIVPTMNPDGYAYTITTDRLWRKNLRNNGDGSTGVDLNRNFSVGWSAPEGGNSTIPSDLTYRGPSAFSEPETQVIRDWTNSLPNLGAFMDLHSYSQLILAPQGYTVALPARQPEFEFITPEMTSAVNNTNGVIYVGGPTATTIYIAAGTSSDWAYGVKNVYGYGMELRDTGTNGFVLPPNQIIPNAQEVWNGLAVLANYLNVKFKVSVPAQPSEVSSTQATPVGVTAVAFNNLTAAPGGLRLFTRQGTSGPFTQSALTGTLPNLTATLPTTPCGTTLQYYVEVQASDGSLTRAPANAPAAVYSATSANVVAVASDDFEAVNAGWQVNIDNTDTATTGRWARGVPQLTGYQPGADHTPGAGTACWVTDPAAGTNDGAFDVDNGKTSLYSQTLNLASNPTAVVGYWRWFDKTGGATNTADTLIVSVSNGGAYVQVENVPFAESQGGWFYKEFRVSDFVTPTATVRVRFVATDANPGNVVEAAIDDFAVRATTPCPPPACVGDLNGDNAVNTADLTAFLGAFGTTVTPGTSGDLNGDGAVNTTDLTTFLGRFGQSCP